MTNIIFESFSQCKKLTSVIIPNSVKQIQFYAFSGCTGLIRVDNYCEASVFIDHDVFENADVESAVLHVLRGKKAEFEQHEVWGQFGTIIDDLVEYNAIDEVGADGTANFDPIAPMDVYNMQGVRVAGSLDNLPAGVYIVCQGAKSFKLKI